MSKNPSESKKKQSPDPQELVVQLYRTYASQVSKTLWPWETARWYELVFCILTTIGEPHVLAATVRRLTNTMSGLGLLELDALKGQDLDEKDFDRPNRFSLQSQPPQGSQVNLRPQPFTDKPMWKR